MPAQYSSYSILRKHKIYFIATSLLLCGLYASVVPAMVMQWYHDPNYSHGFIVPIIAVYLLYRKRNFLEKVPVRPNNYGLAIIVIGLLLLTVSSVGLELFTMRLSLIILIAGMVLYFFGKEFFRNYFYASRLSIVYDSSTLYYL